MNKVNDQQIKDRAEAIGYNKGYLTGLARGYDVGQMRANLYWVKKYEEDFQKVKQFLQSVEIFKPTLNPKAKKEVEEILNDHN